MDDLKRKNRVKHSLEARPAPQVERFQRHEARHEAEGLITMTQACATTATLVEATHEKRAHYRGMQSACALN